MSVKIDLPEWYALGIDKRTDYLIAGGELTELSRQTLIIVDDLKRCGAIISDENTLKYYEMRKKSIDCCVKPG